MEYPNNTKKMQFPTHPQFLANGVPFGSLSPSFVPDGPYLSASESRKMGFNMPPPIDVDQSLSNVFSLLNFSTDRQPFLSRTLGGQISSSLGVGEHPIGSPRLIHPDEEFINSFTAEPRQYHHHHHRRCNNTNGSSGFDYEFDFDQKSRLGSKNQAADISINGNLKFHRSDDEHLTPSYSNHLPFESHWCLKELRGRVYALAKDQNGCRILQALLERPRAEEVELVLSEVVESISDLMKDQFGNYLFQKLVAVCNENQKMQILVSLTKIPSNMMVVCMNPHGTRAVQKLLEHLNDPLQVKLVMKALHHGATALANHPNGHHVIQYCLLHFHSDINKPIVSEIADACYKVATDRSGCCVLQACVEQSRGEVRRRLVGEIMANSLHLAEDPFGNYVVQHMLGLNVPAFTSLLVRQLQGNFACLSCNKYGSNVVEKCLNESGEDVSTTIILELIRSPNSSLLLVDPYANFVIQSALKVSKGLAHECLRGLILKNISTMRTNLYGKKILETLEKRPRVRIRS